MVPESVMPTYPFLLSAGLANARADATGQAMPDSASAEGVLEPYGEDTHVRAFDGEPGRLTEMDAVVAYLQILGGLTDLAQADTTPPEE
jgi:cytochrome c oxidase cbb3-type subunit 2